MIVIGDNLLEKYTKIKNSLIYSLNNTVFSCSLMYEKKYFFRCNSTFGQKKVEIVGNWVDFGQNRGDF